MSMKYNETAESHTTNAEVKNLGGVHEMDRKETMRRDFDNANDAADFAYARKSMYVHTCMYMHLDFLRKRLNAENIVIYRHFDIDDLID